MMHALFMVAPLFVGWILDMLFGDPVWMPNPVRLIGQFISNLEPVFFGAFPQNPKGERHAGNLLALLVPLVSLLVAAISLACARLLHPGLWFALESMLCYQLLSTRNLHEESMRVCGLLENREEHGDLSRARLALSRIAGRDTEKLNSQEITGAAIEAIAEKTNDSAVAPIFFITLGGGSIGVFYKAVDTLKSMVVHENAKYRYLGIAAARLEEVCGFVPARISAMLMILSAWVAGFDGAGAARGFKRDRFNHENPNSAQTESVCAGALGIRLVRSGYHDGVYCVKPAIGSGRQAESNDIRRANRLMILTSFFSVVLFSVAKLAILMLLMYI